MAKNSFSPLAGSVLEKLAPKALLTVKQHLRVAARQSFAPVVRLTLLVGQHERTLSLPISSATNKLSTNNCSKLQQ
jgi:hypothetical protein